MKKRSLFSLLLITMACLTIVGCGRKDTEITEDMTDEEYEEYQEMQEELEEDYEDDDSEAETDSEEEEDDPEILAEFDKSDMWDTYLNNCAGDVQICDVYAHLGMTISDFIAEIEDSSVTDQGLTWEYDYNPDMDITDDTEYYLDFTLTDGDHDYVVLEIGLYNVTNEEVVTQAEGSLIEINYTNKTSYIDGEDVELASNAIRVIDGRTLNEFASISVDEIEALFEGYTAELDTAEFSETEDNTTRTYYWSLQYAIYFDTESRLSENAQYCSNTVSFTYDLDSGELTNWFSSTGNKVASNIESEDFTNSYSIN